MDKNQGNTQAIQTIGNNSTTNETSQKVIWVSGNAPREEIIADIMNFVEQAKKEQAKKA